MCEIPAVGRDNYHVFFALLLFQDGYLEDSYNYRTFPTVELINVAAKSLWKVLVYVGYVYDGF